MAAPGYPNMPGQMPPGMGGPMGGPPMGGPPMGGPPGGPPMMAPRPVRRGTSKAVPVVVSAGLAVGVFCGLLFGVGTGKATAGTKASNRDKLDTGEAKTEPGAAPTGLGATAAKPVDPPKPNPPPGPGSAVAVAAVGSGGSAAPAVVTPPKPAVEEKKLLKLTVKIKPEAAASVAKIKIDGKDIDGLATDLPGDIKSFKLEVKAEGYRSLEKKIDTIADKDATGTTTMSVEFELQKKPAPGTGVRPPRRPDRPTNAGPSGGGLIDI